MKSLRPPLPVKPRNPLQIPLRRLPADLPRNRRHLLLRQQRRLLPPNVSTNNENPDDQRHEFHPGANSPLTLRPLCSLCGNSCLFLLSLLHFFFASLPRRLFISTFIPSIGFRLFNFAASTINFFSPGLFKPPAVRPFTCRTLFPVPSSNPSGSGSTAPRKKINVTCSFPVMKPHTVPFKSNDGIFHGFTYSSLPAIVFFTSARKPFVTPFSFPAFSTYPSIHNRPSFPSIVGIFTSSHFAAI